MNIDVTLNDEQVDIRFETVDLLMLWGVLRAFMTRGSLTIVTPTRANLKIIR